MLNVRQERWLTLISEFDFEIKYIKGEEKEVIDALSRALQLAHVVDISTSEVDIKERIK